ncbi:MAG: hypothetical protein AAFX06_17950 [Planctomycetota bacterium]
MNEPKQNSIAPLVIVGVVTVALVAIGGYMASRPEMRLAQEDAPDVDSSKGPEMTMVGGVMRPVSDIKRIWDRDEKYEVDQDFALFPGKTPGLKEGDNPAVDSILEAARTGSNPERLNPFVKPEPFDRLAYEQDPDAYVSLHVPGRVWQSAQPGEGVPVLKAASEHRHRVKQGEAVRLSVKTLPGMPVTFVSFDSAGFENGLAVISVSADENGIASANFAGVSGTMGLINILAASPVATERVRFGVYVDFPITQSTSSIPESGSSTEASL